MKLITCEKKSFGSQPKSSPVSRTVSLRLAARNIAFITKNVPPMQTHPRGLSYLLVNQEKGVEDDRFRQCDRENCVHQNGRERPRIPSNGCRHSEAGQTNANANTHRRQADVNASADFC